ncbi:MAG: hypothetical protein HY924_14110 [Elusimicrobia bacterium]|nr:hypothetical protein [Elusimicrobiota bacterium]
MRTRGSLGWLFLAVVLAVPAVMYYKSYTAKERERKLADKAKVRVPEGPLFPEPSNGQKFTNPINTAGPAGDVPAAAAALSTEAATQAAITAVDAALPAAQPDPAGPPPQQDASAPVPAETPAPAPQAQPAAPTQTTQSQQPQPARPEAQPAPADAPAAAAAPAATPPAAAEVAVSTADLVAVDWRDPLLSPYDQFLVEQEELEKLIKKKEVEEAAKQARAQRERPVDQTLSLQGIVTMPDGNKAIINNDMYGEGEWIGNTGVKVVKISQNSVTFAHKGRTFSKRMQ